MQHNIVIINFPRPNDAFQALTALRADLAQQLVDVDGVAIVERQQDGSLQVNPAHAEAVPEGSLAIGSLLGAALGLLGGPVGTVIGAAAGAALGHAAGQRRAATTGVHLQQIAEAVGVQCTALILSAAEHDVHVLDRLAERLDGQMTRVPREAVERELVSNG